MAYGLKACGCHPLKFCIGTLANDKPIFLSVYFVFEKDLSSGPHPAITLIAFHVFPT